MGKHTGPRNVLAENLAYVIAELGHPDPLRGRHHKTCAPAIIRAHYNRWLNSTEQQHLTRKEQHAHPVNPT